MYEGSVLTNGVMECERRRSEERLRKVKECLNSRNGMFFFVFFYKRKKLLDVFRPFSLSN